ncbi:XPG I-region-domain-containing protein, partial [Suillus occidentalis]
WMHSICAVFQMNHAGAGKSPELRTLFFLTSCSSQASSAHHLCLYGLTCLPDKGHKVRHSPHWLTRDFQCMVDLFGSFDHLIAAQAPSEAEAELAAMNVHGIIDAVMTEDSDVLIFGALCIIRSAKNDRDYYNVHVYTEDGCEHGASLAQGDWLLIVLLVGGDYDRGVPGCGITIAH